MTAFRPSSLQHSAVEMIHFPSLKMLEQFRQSPVAQVRCSQFIRQHKSENAKLVRKKRKSTDSFLRFSFQFVSSWFSFSFRVVFVSSELKPWGWRISFEFRCKCLHSIHSDSSRGGGRVVCVGEYISRPTFLLLCHFCDGELFTENGKWVDGSVRIRASARAPKSAQIFRFNRLRCHSVNCWRNTLTLIQLLWFKVYEGLRLMDFNETRTAELVRTAIVRDWMIRDTNT